jgi:penicillin amidase
MFRRCLLATLGVVVVAATSYAATVDIVRDKWGVPHIFVPASVGNKTAQLKALGFAQGYATAQDRMVQLEFFRRAAKGRLSEIAAIGGAANLPADMATRRDGLTDAERQALIKKLPKTFQLSLQAFADGVNQFLHEVEMDPSKAPFEFVITGQPDPWTTADSAAVAELEIRRFGQNGGGEIDNAALLLDLLDKFSPSEAQGIFNDLFWLEDPNAPTTIDPNEKTKKFKLDKYTPFADLQMTLITTHAAAIRGMLTALQEERAAIARANRNIGVPRTFPSHSSNAMVVSGALAANGVPVLLGGPQTGMSVPSFFHEIGLHGGGYDAEGVTVPGGAGLVIGRTATAAWSITSGITDNTDVYIETLNPSNPKQYMYKGKFQDMSCRMETFNPAGQPPETHEFCRTVHGPVFASYPSDGVAFSQRIYMFGHEIAEAQALLSLGFSTKLSQFKGTINKLDASLNCMYADTSGNIAYFHRGIRPHRPSNLDTRLPLPATGEGEPKGALKGGGMPTIINPKLGYIAQWNNKPTKGWSTDDQRELWGGADRVQVLLDQLAAAKAANHKISTDDLANYMKVAATTDFFAPRVFPYLQAAVDALPSSTPDRSQLETATGLVQTWLQSGGQLLADGTGNIPNPGVTIYRAWRQQVQTDTFGDELGSHKRAIKYFQNSPNGDNQDDSGELFTPDALFLRALAGTSATFPTSRDYFENVTTGTNPGRDATLVASLRTALANLATQYHTSNMNQWLTPKITVQFAAESAASVSMERENRGTFNEIIELSTPPSGRIIVPAGNSGYISPDFVESPHLRDQLPLYEAFQYRTMPFAPTDLEGPTTTTTLTLP